MAKPSNADDLEAELAAVFSNGSDDDPTSLRLKYRRALAAVERHISFDASFSSASEHLNNLCLMLADLDRGVVHPVLAPSEVPNRRPDSSFVWLGRAGVVGSILLLELSGVTHDQAIDVVVNEYPQCSRLLRPGAGFETSLRKWCKDFNAGRVPDCAAGGFSLFSDIAAMVGPNDDGDCFLARQYLAAVSERSAGFDPDPDWWRDEFPDE